jgi:hypothetical protein
MENFVKEVNYLEPDDDKYIKGLPEDNIDQRVRRDHVPYDIWERQGHIMV